MLFNTLLKNNVSRLIDSFVFEKITILHEGKIGKEIFLVALRGERPTRGHRGGVSFVFAAITD